MARSHGPSEEVSFCLMRSGLMGGLMGGFGGVLFYFWVFMVCEG